MLSGFGAILMPLSLLMMVLRQKGPITRFIEAGAISPQTARRPTSIEVKNHEFPRRAVRRAVLVDMGDGRYYVDVPRFRRGRRTLVGLSVALVIIGVAAALVIWFSR